MPRSIQYFFGVLIAALLILGPLSYSSYWQSQVRNFRVVRDGVLYRSGQTSLAGMKRILHDYGIKTVVSLRDAMHPGDPPPDRQEEDYCRAEEINFYRIPPRSWWSIDGSVPAAEGVRQFRAIMDNPKNFPVLVHCFGGIHRTGAFCAVYRMEYEHWSNEEALAEMRACGYSTVDDEWDILTFLEQYRPRWQKTADSPHPPVPQIGGGERGATDQPPLPKNTPKRVKKKRSKVRATDAGTGKS